MKTFFTNKLKKFMLITFIILLIAEIFIFNYKSFVINPLNHSEYKHQTFSLEDATLEGLTYLPETDTYVLDHSNATVTFFMNAPVQTMFFDIKPIYYNGKDLEIGIQYATESYKDFKQSEKAFHIVPSVKNSNYVTCSYFGNVTKIKLTLRGDASTQFRIGNFETNKRIPVNFSALRVFFLLLLSCLVYTFLKYPAFGDSFDLKRRSHKYATIFVLLAFISFILFVYSLYVGNCDWFDQTTGNQMTQELVDAFENGQVHLTDPVPEGLLNLENPYDLSERSNAGLSYKWDHLLFEGKYYSYYGIAPVLTLFLPYHMITGHYFASSLACLLYTLIAAIFLGLCFISIVRNWFYHTPFRLVIMGLMITLFSSCVMINVMSPQFYEIAQSSALCFLVLGFYFMLNSGIFTKENIKLRYLCLSSLFTSLSVLSRATCALYAMVLVIWAVYGYLRYRKEHQGNKAALIKYILAAAAPYIIFAIIQMTYNYLRFGNPLDFGIQYTLTIYDYENIDLHFSMIMISIVNFFFAVPIINTQFPFIHGNFDSLKVNGYYFVATNPTLGIIPITPTVLSLLYTPKVAKFFPKKDKIKYFLIWFLPGLIIPVILAAMTWEYGYSMRYNADFGWQISIASFVLIYFVYHQINNATIKKWLMRILLIATVWSVLCYLTTVFSTNPIQAVNHNLKGSNIYYYLKNLIEFWG